jgi:hypothetical protein
MFVREPVVASLRFAAGSFNGGAEKEKRRMLSFPRRPLRRKENKALVRTNLRRGNE